MLWMFLPSLSRDHAFESAILDFSTLFYYIAIYFGIKQYPSSLSMFTLFVFSGGMKFLRENNEVL